MEFWQAIVLGIVEGLTEYLPVSSTGHLILAQRAMGMENSVHANAYAICIQAGAIVAVLGIYFKRVQQMIRGVLGKDPTGLKMAINVIVAFMPAAVIGVIFDEQIEHYLFGLWPIVVAWLIGGVVILVFHQKRKNVPATQGADLSVMTWKMALLIGVIQVIAMWPGTSRSLVTILGGLLAGLSLASAVEFSFLLGVVTLTAATVFKARHGGPEMVEHYGWANIALGFVVAAISAAAAVKWMVAYLNRHGLAIFGYYRIAVGVIVGALLLMGLLPNN